MTSPTSVIIAIANSNFETPTLKDDTIINSTIVANPISDWTIYDPTGVIYRADTTALDYADIGTWNPPIAAYPKGTLNGDNVAFVYIPTSTGAPNQIGEGFAGISQTLESTTVANKLYTLTVDVGNPQSYFSNVLNFAYDYDGFPGYRVELLAGDEVVAVDNNHLTIAEGAFSNISISFSSASGDTIIGKKLGIRLINLNTSAGTEVDFDNVSLKLEDTVIQAITTNQTLFGSRGKTLSGGQGDDTLYGNGLSTVMFGRDGNDKIYGSAQDEYIVGGAGNDTLFGNGGKDTLYGDAGDDLIYGGSHADTIFAGVGNDTVYGNGGGDFVNTGSGFDKVFLGAGSDILALETGEGYDTVINFQLGSSRLAVGRLLADLNFSDSYAGVQIFAGSDLLAVISGQSATTFESNISNIFI